jgi:hypothetical protein
MKRVVRLFHFYAEYWNFWSSQTPRIGLRHESELQGLRSSAQQKIDVEINIYWSADRLIQGRFRYNQRSKMVHI